MRKQRYNRTNTQKGEVFMDYAASNPMESLANAMTPKFAVSYLRVSTRGQAERGGGADEIGRAHV